MSLLDALLLEGYRDPREVWIALRSDAQKGSGTIDDPYDGGTRLGPPLSATLSCDRFEFVVGLLGHGLSETTSHVTITGVQGPGALWFNGTFTVQKVLSTSHFTLLANNPAQPSVIPPAPPDVQYFFNPIKATLPNGTTPVVRVYWPVAKVTVPANHGLGVFDGVTISDVSPDVSPIGYAGDYPILGPSDQSDFACLLKFRPGDNDCSSRSCTVRRLSHRFDEVMRNVPVPLNSVIHLAPGTFETRGYAALHVAHPSDFSQLYVGYILRDGQRLLGSGIGATTLKLVLPLDNLSQTTAVGNPGTPSANYAEVADLTVDCNVAGHVAPYGIFPAPVTCGAVLLGGSFIRLRRVRAISFCVQALPEGFPLGVSQGGSTAPTFDVIEDCIVENPGENNTHETTLISIFGDAVTANAISPIVRHNYHNCEYAAGISSEHVAVQTLNGPDGNGIVTLTTKRPHNQEGKLMVLLQNATPNDSLHNRSFKITGITSATQLTFYSGSVAAFGGGDAFIGPAFYGRGALSGTGCVTEGNVFFNCTTGLYQDTGSTRDLVCRDNYYSNVSAGVNFNIDGGVEEPPRSAASLTKVDSTIANFQSQVPHLLRQGEAVRIDGAFINGDPNNPYNGSFSVLSVVSATEFRYVVKNPPLNANADPPTPQNPIRFVSRWQVRRSVYENNVFELYRFDANSVLLNKVVTTFGYDSGLLPPFTPPPFTFPQATIRENLFRLADGSVVPVGVRLGLGLYTSENYLVESNIIDIPDVNAIRYLVSQSINAFNNRTSFGQPLPLFEETLPSHAFLKKDTLEDKVTDALSLGFL